MRGPRLASLVALALAALVAGGCASKPKMIPARPAEELYAKAEREASRKRWDLAADELRTLVETHPYHELAPHAEIRLGEMYFLDRRYTEAIAVFEEFLKIRPTHPQAAYALYLLGSSHYHERVTFDRDPTQTEKAARAFERLLKEYADAPQAALARTRLSEARSELAEHELYIGNFYFREQRYDAALRRFQKVTRLYPEQPAADLARLRAGETELRLGRKEAAQQTLSALLARQPAPDVRGQATRVLERAGLAPLPVTDRADRAAVR